MDDPNTVNSPTDYEAAFADSEKRDKYIPPEGTYAGSIALDHQGKRWVKTDRKNGKVRYALKFDPQFNEKRWVWAELDTRNPAEEGKASLAGAKTRVKLMARTVAAFAAGVTNGDGKALVTTFTDKAKWSTADLTDYSAEVLKASSAHVSFKVEYRTKDGEPDLDRNGDQRYNVYVNGAISNVAAANGAVQS